MRRVIAGVLLAGGVALAWFGMRRKPTAKHVTGDELLDQAEGTRVSVAGAFSEHGAGGSEPPSRPAYGIVMDHSGGFHIGSWVVGIPPAGAVDGTLILVTGTVRIAKDMGYATGLVDPRDPAPAEISHDMQYLEAEHVEIL